MATVVSTDYMNLAEAQKREHYEGSAALLAEIIKHNDFFGLLPWFPSNTGTIHKSIKAKKLGEGSFIEVNGEIPTMSSETELQITQICGYGGVSKVDDKLLKVVTEPQKAREAEDVMNLEGLLQGYCTKIIYGDASDPDAFKGLAELRNAITAKRVWSAGGTTANKQTSAWLIEFGERGVCMRYPSNAGAGFKNEDMGRIAEVNTSTGGTKYMWHRQYSIYGGLQVFNEKCLLRMANIEMGVTGKNFNIQKFLEMKNELPSHGKNAALLVNPDLYAELEYQLYEKSNLLYTRKEVEGFGDVLQVCGVPVVRAEAIKMTEAVIS